MNDTKGSPLSLKIKSKRGKPMSFEQFLQKLKQDPTITDTVWDRLQRTVEDGGKLPPNDRYLRMLKLLGIESYKVFEGFKGSERIIHRVFESPLDRQMLVFLGPPGSGKTYAVGKVVGLMSNSTFYVVDGCPHTEDAINLLKLIESEDEIRAIGKEIGYEDGLVRLWQRALPPCNCCFAKAHGRNSECSSNNVTDSEPSFDHFKIVPIKLSPRPGYGMSVWTAQPDNPDAVPLKHALKQGSHLTVLRDGFAAKGAQPGSVNPTHELLAAIQEKVVDGGPHNGLIAAETNESAWKEFTSTSTHLDPGAYIRRSRVIRVPYNMVLSRELAIYKDELDKHPKDEIPIFDPFALAVPAYLAIASRLKKELAGHPALLDRIHINDGDLAPLELFLKGRSTVTTTPGTNFKASRMEALRDGVFAMWKDAGSEEGFSGLNVGFMLEDIIKPMRVAGLRLKDKRITPFQAALFCAERIQNQLISSDALSDSGQKQMYRDCLENLKLAKNRWDQPSLVERAIRLDLHRRVIEAFCPDLEAQRAEYFADYYALALSYSAKQGDLSQPDKDKMQAIESKIPDLSVYDSSKLDKYRASLAGKVNNQIKVLADIDPTISRTPSWQAAPADLRTGINKVIIEQVVKQIETCLKADKKSELPPNMEALRVQSLARFLANGYSEETAKQSLAYYVSFELWQLAQDGLSQ